MYSGGSNNLHTKQNKYKEENELSDDKSEEGQYSEEEDEQHDTIEEGRNKESDDTEDTEDNT